MIQIYCFKFVLETHGEDESSNKPKEGTLFQCFTISSYNYILLSIINLCSINLSDNSRHIPRQN